MDAHSISNTNDTRASPLRLLIIDDDRELCDLLREYLGSMGFTVETVNDVHEGIRRAVTNQFAVTVLDVMLPGLDGFEALRRIRAQSLAPVLMLTARGEEVDRIVGLEIGADDYLPKPFNPRELVARIRAILRRSSADTATSHTLRDPAIIVGDLKLDPGSRATECGGRSIELTSAEFDLLILLARSAGRVVSREELSQEAFGRRLFPEDRSIDVHISHLRRKLGPLNSKSGGGDRIKTLRGTGYLYVVANDATAAAHAARSGGAAKSP